MQSSCKWKISVKATLGQKYFILWNIFFLFIKDWWLLSLGCCIAYKMLNNEPMITEPCLVPWNRASLYEFQSSFQVVCKVMKNCPFAIYHHFNCRYMVTISEYKDCKSCKVFKHFGIRWQQCSYVWFVRRSLIIDPIQ